MSEDDPVTEAEDRATAPSRIEAVLDFLLADRRGPEGLDDHDRLLATVGCLVAVDPGGDELRQVLGAGLDAGVGAKSLESMLLHAVAYLGVVQVRRAYDSLMAELRARRRQDELLSTYQVDDDRDARVKAGTELYNVIRPGRPGEYFSRFEPISPRFYPRGMEMAGLALAAGLPVRDGEILTVSILSCLGGQPDQLRFHIDVALERGVTQEGVASLLMMVQVFAGIPRATLAADCALATITARAGARGRQ